MAGSALKRLMAEHRQLMKNPPEGIVAGPRGDENYFEWEAHILGKRFTFFPAEIKTCILTLCKTLYKNLRRSSKLCIKPKLKDLQIHASSMAFSKRRLLFQKIIQCHHQKCVSFLIYVILMFMLMVWI